MVSRQATHVLMYVQHLLGIGHLIRSRRLAAGLVDRGYVVTLIVGGLPLERTSESFCEINLPAIAVKHGDFSQLVDENGSPIDDAFRAHRSKALQDIVLESEPDIVVFEAFPFGRRQVHFELLPLLEKLKTREPRPLIVSSVRDILQIRHKPGRDQETVELIRTYFDAVLVHGDPSFIKLEDSFRLAGQITDKTFYTGLISSPLKGAPTEDFAVIVSAGGGSVGQKLLTAALKASSELSDTGRWCVISGPNCSQPEFNRLSRLAPAHVVLERFRADFPDLLHGVSLSISQAGYNTVSDILQANCRAVLVPFSANGETEQMSRAKRLHELGRIELIEEDALTADQLINSIDRCMNSPIPHTKLDIQTDGIQRTAEVLQSLLAPTA